MRIGYARVSTQDQDLQSQISQLEDLGVHVLYTDRGLSGTHRSRPGLLQSLAACRQGDTLVVTKLDRLARSLVDAQALFSELTAKGIHLQIGRETYDPNSATGMLLFRVLAMVAEFERDLISQRTKEGMAIARERGRLKGRKPALSARQQEHLRTDRASGMTIRELAKTYNISPTSVHRILAKS